jgi:uncharacterized protein (DUF362 family)
MASAAQLNAAPRGASWRVSRDGSSVAAVVVRHEGGEVVVAADLAAGAAPAVLHRFGTLEAAEEFVSDLIASFSYLGCDVGPTT